MSQDTMKAALLDAGFTPVAERKPREPKIQKCRKCGAPMKFVENTNVLVCTGDIEVKNADGTARFVPCLNKFIFKVI